MTVQVFMPALSPTMTEGNLVKWVKKEGDRINAGDVMCEIETDKATMEVEAVDEGVLGKIFIPEGSEGVKVNSLIAVLLEDGEDASALNDVMISDETEIKVVAAQKYEEKMVHINVPQTAKADDRIFATPLAKRIAQNKNMSLNSITGSGPHGRIVKSDIENMQTTSQQQVEIQGLVYEDKKVSLMRKTVAKRLTESKNTVPHFYLIADCELDALLALRAQINAESSHKISVNDMVIKACSKVLQDVPEINVTWHDTYIRQYRNIDISVAVAIDGGLVTPVLCNTENMKLSEISTSVKALAEKARAGKLQPHEYEGGSFTVSNLGMYGVKEFSAIVNPPQGCILAVGAGEKRVIVKNDKPAVATIMTVTLSVDHRSVDGALGAQFLKSFKKYIEHPVLTLV
ncbi:MAG TPA: pyruvate dehydrogenase complex dihydrolipoamide acetyltransferase [Holosporales bacterium]|nr:pyruvate dehydrogenase complex dihydrolipoamide acetyltransferase [Holosporales bacterium]